MRSLGWLQLVADSDLSANARLVAAMLACHSRGGSYPVSGAPVARLMTWTGLSRSAVQRARDELVAGGWVVVVHGTRGGRTLANDYALTAPHQDHRAGPDSGVIHTPRAAPSLPVDSLPNPGPGVSPRYRGGVTETPHEGVSQTPLKGKSESRGEALARAVDNVARRMAL